MDSGFLRRLVTRVARIGSDPNDSSEIALQKRLDVAPTSVPAMPIAEKAHL
jgi:hypothetical protein